MLLSNAAKPSSAMYFRPVLLRGLGDLDFKERNFISCQPQLTRVPLMPGVDTFSVLASDGVWGFVEDQEVVDTVGKVLQQVRPGREGR